MTVISRMDFTIQTSSLTGSSIPTMHKQVRSAMTFDSSSQSTVSRLPSFSTFEPASRLKRKKNEDPIKIIKGSTFNLKTIVIFMKNELLIMY